jgi:hypothetical protein
VFQELLFVLTKDIGDFRPMRSSLPGVVLGLTDGLDGECIKGVGN